MMRRSRIALAALAILVAMPATAVADAPELTPLTAARFPEREFVLTLPAERRLGSSDIEVRENGEPVATPSLVPADRLGNAAFATVLVIDGSETMRGDAIAGAIEAARTFAGRRRLEQHLGVIVFNKRPVVTLPLTADQAEIDAALSSLPPIEGGTTIHDAALDGIDMLREARSTGGSVVLLSDGADTSSDHAGPSEVVAAARRAGVRIFTVGLESSAYRPETLERLADETGGDYALASSPRALEGIFDRLGTTLSSQYLVRYRSFGRPREHVAVEVRVRGEEPATADYTAPALALEPAAAFRRSVADDLWRSPVAVLLAALIAGLLVGAIVLMLLRRRGNGLLERLAHFVPSRSDEVESRPRAAAPRRSRLSEVGAWERFREDLDIARIDVGAGRLALLSLVGGAVVGWLLVTLSGVGGAALFGLAAPVAMRVVVRFKAGRERRAFAEQLADNVQVIASAMRAGHSFVGALSVVVEEAAEPSRREFMRVVQDERLGKPIEQAFSELAERMRNDELEHLGLVARLQTETGGNTAEVLDRLVETLRARADVRRLVRTLTAQGRLGGWVVGSLPVVLLVALTVMSPAYAQKVFETGSGHVMLAVSAVLIGLGTFAIRRIVDIKV
jgi:tight adherence protein B